MILKVVSAFTGYSTEVLKMFVYFHVTIAQLKILLSSDCFSKILNFKPGFLSGNFCLSLLVLVFHTNKKPKRAMQCSNRNIYKKPKRATKAKTNNQRHLPVLVFEIEMILSQKQDRATKRSKKQ